MVKPKVLAVIGARSGSKSVPHKNIRLLGGKPLLAWSVGAAKKSKLVDRVIVSTDSPEYAKIARKHGAETPFLRPADISGDKATDMEYLKHAVKWLEDNEGWKADIVLRIMPTVPFSNPKTIDACVSLLIENPKADSVRTITPASHHPFKMWRAEGPYLAPAFNKKITGFENSPEHPRQLFPKMYSHADPIVMRYDALMKKGHLGRKIKFIQISSQEAIDINNEIDFSLAEAVLNNKSSKK